jgi:RNA polymerase sigma-70 factor (ECF subfamily)
VEESTPSVLEQISTRWPSITDPARFVLRYAPAIRRYLGAVLRDPDAVDEVTQDFLVNALQRRFDAGAVRGRFRHYLKAALRNAAATYWRRLPPASQAAAAEPAAEDPAGERVWLDDWRRCLLERAWDALEARQRAAPDSLCYAALRLTADHPDEDSAALAARAAALCGRPVRPDAFRKQLSRARRLFARLLAAEAARTLEDPTPALVEEELADLGLLVHVRPYLPADWREVGQEE